MTIYNFTINRSVNDDEMEFIGCVFGSSIMVVFSVCALTTMASANPVQHAAFFMLGWCFVGWLLEKGAEWFLLNSYRGSKHSSPSAAAASPRS